MEYTIFTDIKSDPEFVGMWTLKGVTHTKNYGLFAVAIEAVKKLSAEVGIAAKLDKLCKEDLAFLAQSAAAGRLRLGNPKPATVDDFKALFHKIM